MTGPLPSAVDVHRNLMPDGNHLTLFDVTLVLDAIRAVDAPAADATSEDTTDG